MTQDEALGVLKSGANVFLTGEPGSGKTHTINQYIAYLRAHGINPAVTASTGIAATHVGGMTIHSWSGVGIRRKLSGYELEELASREPLVKRIAHAKVLIIDEISMLDGKILDLVDRVCREVRRRHEEPFGGLQVIFVGDFFQLPPIARADEGEMQFCFLSQAWNAANPLPCYLSEQHRQEDETYLQILSAIRRNDIEDGAIELLQERMIAHHKEAKTATKLFTHNADVDRINQDELNKLSGEIHEHVMTTHGSQKIIEGMKKSCLSPERLQLKIGATVMFTKNNFDAGYVNGTLGKVAEYTDGELYPMVKTLDGKSIVVQPVDWAYEEDGKVRAKLTQLPLRLAWAITVHKSQGMSMDRAVIDLSQAFEYGQGYVALSRVRSREGLFLLGINPRALQVHPEILLVDEAFREHSSSVQRGFAKLSQEERDTMEKNFLAAIGGTMIKAKKRTKESQHTDNAIKKNFIEIAREKSPNAFRRWSKEEEAQLRKYFDDKLSISEIADKLGRREGGVIVRLKKLSLVSEDFVVGSPSGGL